MSTILIILVLILLLGGGGYCRSVVNDADETIGKIDDLLVSPDGKQPYAVLSIGGFLGMGAHLVVVPYDTLKFAEKK